MASISRSSIAEGSGLAGADRRVPSMAKRDPRIISGQALRRPAGRVSALRGSLPSVSTARTRRNAMDRTSSSPTIAVADLCALFGDDIRMSTSALALLEEISYHATWWGGHPPKGSERPISPEREVTTVDPFVMTATLPSSSPATVGKPSSAGATSSVKGTLDPARRAVRQAVEQAGMTLKQVGQIKGAQKRLGQ